MRYYLKFSSMAEFNGFNQVLEPIWKNEDGSIKPPFPEGTLFYMNAIRNRDSENPEVIAILDQRIIDFAQNNNTVASAIQNDRITQQEAIDQNFLPEPRLEP